MTLLRFEFIKVFRKPYVIISILLFTLVNFAAIFITNKGYQTWVMEKDQNQVCKAFLCGPIEREKIDRVISETKRLSDIVASQKFSREYDPNTITGYLFGDFNLYSGYLEPHLKYAVSYAYDMQDILQRTEDNIQFYKQVGNTKELNKNQDIARLYSGRSINEYRNLYGARYLLFYDFSGLLIIFLLVLTLSPGFVGEKENRMDQLFPTFPRGEGKVNATKFTFILLITVLYCFWFFIMDLIGFALFSHLQGFSMPLYSIKEFQLTPLTLSIGQYYGVSWILKIIGMLIVSLYIAILSKILPKSVYVFLGSLLPLVMFVFWLPRIQSPLAWLDFVNPMHLIKNRFLFLTYNPIFIGSHPIQPVFLVVGVALLLIIISSIVIQTKIRTKLV